MRITSLILRLSIVQTSKYIHTIATSHIFIMFRSLMNVINTVLLCGRCLLFLRGKVLLSIIRYLFSETVVLTVKDRLLYNDPSMVLRLTPKSEHLKTGRKIYKMIPVLSRVSLYICYLSLTASFDLFANIYLHA